MITDPKILDKLKRIEQRYTPFCFEAVGEMPVEMAETKEHFRNVPDAEAKLKWKPAKAGTRWGGGWMTAWFRGSAKLSASCAGQKVFLRAKTGASEAMLIVDGEHRGVFDGNHPVVMMTANGEAGRAYEVAIEAYAMHPFAGTQPDDTGTRGFERTFETIELVLQREDVTAFVFDLGVLLKLVDSLDEHSLRRNKVIAGLAEVYRVIDAMPAERPEETWRPKLQQARKIMWPLLDAKNSATTPLMGLVGHSHIDTAWLWTVAETERKCARTFSSVLNLMEQYPEFHFIQSAPCHADIVRREYPGIFQRMQAMVKAGRWEPNGAMWVEPDCNIPSGEAFVRQLLVGQTATREWYGYTSDAYWQPDVFGYSAALPQILRGCGVEYFLTTKISWNDTTRFPYDTFFWTGIDGSSVISHFFNIHCWPEPKTLAEQWRAVQHKDVQDRRLCTFGFGDGGGGPMFEMLETARRVADLEGCPRAKHTTVSDWMKGIRDELGPHLPEWVGELYLELHRGTLTSIAEIKRGNRKSELALRDAEFMATVAALSGYDYPHERLLAIWKQLLTNQFHDILPGSSINEVNDQAIAEFQQCVADAESLSATALEAIVDKPPRRASAVLIVNSLSWDRCGELSLDNVPAGKIPADPSVTGQWVEDANGQRRLVVSGVDVPALGSVRLDLIKGEATGSSPFKVNKGSLETPFAKVRFDRAGRIVSLVDKASGREVVKQGGALNTFWLGEDIPRNYDNWDIDFDQQLKMQRQDRLIKREVVANGPLQLRVRSEYAIGDNSSIIQDMVFHATSAQVDFDTVVEWDERHKLLKAGFAVDVLAENARHDLQFGHLERPTHRNRLSDKAQFEVANHKWTDLSESGFGVALLNDCKYGVSVDGGDMRLSLIKSGTHPDSRGDRGRHRFTYSLLPRACAFSVESVVHPAYELNVDPIVRPVAADAQPFSSLVTVNAPNIIVESVKWAEDGDGFVLRLYEASKCGTFATLQFAAAVGAVAETNMLEEDAKALKVKDGAVELYFRPFEIKTVKVVTC